MTGRGGVVGRMPIALPTPPPQHGPVRLRPPEGRDAEPVLRACADPAVRRYTRIPPDYGAHDARAFVRDATARRLLGRSLELVATDRPDDALCGVVGVVVDHHDPARAEIGYWTHPDHRGRGIARAALIALSRWCLGPGGFTRLELTVAVGNGPSLAVVAHSGFQREGTARCAWPTPEGREDMAVYSLLAADLVADPSGAPSAP